MQSRLWGPALWTLTGNSTVSLAQWAFIVVISRLLGYGAGGDYALALAIVNPVMMLANLQLRAVQASDARERFHFEDYLTLRLWTLIGASILIVEFGSMTTAPVMVLLAVLALKLVEGLSDVYHGAFQRANRMDWIAQSQITKSALSLALIIIGAAFARPLAVTVGVAAVGCALVWTWYDCAQARQLHLKGVGRILPEWPIPWARIKPLMETAFPLGAVMMLISLNQSIPRFAIERFAGREALGTFAAAAAVAQTVNLALNAIGQSLTVPLAKLVHERNLTAFRALFGKGFLTGAIIAAVLTVASAAGAADLLKVLFAHATPDQAWWLTLQMAAAGITALAGLCGYALTAMGEYRAQLLLFLPLTAVLALANWIFVPVHGVEGACWACLGVSILHLAAAGFLLNLRMAANTVVDSPVPAGGMAE